jgi:hypothetical protein
VTCHRVACVTLKGYKFMGELISSHKNKPKENININYTDELINTTIRRKVHSSYFNKVLK